MKSNLNIFYLNLFFSLFETLTKLAKINKLNYETLKNCGSQLFFSLTEKSTLKEIKSTACEIWTLKEESYDLYDDSFNNLHLNEDVTLTELIQNYTTNDITICEGLIIFYLFEKTKSQNEYLMCQEFCLDPKSNEANNVSKEEVHSNYEDANLVECIDYMKEGKLLKGLNLYKNNQLTEKTLFLRTMRKFENYFLLVLLSIIFIVRDNCIL